MIANLSCIMHMFLFTLNYPANLLNLMNIFFPLVTFNVIPTADEIEKMFHFSEMNDDYALSD